MSLQNTLYNLRQGDEITYQSDLTLNLNQPLFKISTRKINLKKAEISLNRAQLNHIKQKKELIYNITERFLKLYKAKRSLEISRDTEKRAREVYDLAIIKFNHGLYSEMDLLREKVQVVNDKNELINQEEIFKNLSEEFKLYIGLPSRTTINIEHIFNMEPITINQADLIKKAIKNNPDHFLNKLDIELKELNIKQARARRQFTVDMNIEYGVTQQKDEFRKLFTQPDITQLANISINIPLWDSGQNKEEVLSSKEELTNALISLDFTIEQLTVEIKNIYSTYIKNKKLMELTEENEKNALKSYQYRVMNFNTGRITSEDLSISRQQLNRASLNNLSAKIDYMLAVENIKKHLSPMTQ